VEDLETVEEPQVGDDLETIEEPQLVEHL